MCIILDANCYSKYLDLSDEDMHPIRTWIESKNENAKLAYSPTKELISELRNYPKMLEPFLALQRENQIKFINEKDINQEKNTLMKNKPNLNQTIYTL